MAVLTQNTGASNSRIISETTVPKGSYIAVCIEVEDNFGVERLKYGSETEKEFIDTTTFYFGLKKGPDLHVIRSKPFKLSLHEKSALFQFLKQWNNDTPKPGFDTVSMKAQPAQITVEHTMSAKGRIYANISSISPIMEGLEKMVPPAKEFAGLLKPEAKKATPIENTSWADPEEPDEIPF
jgi:hypothetical protein